MIGFLSKVKASLFAEREIICVSDCGIRSKRVGCVFLIWNVLLVMWTAFATVKYFDLRDKIVMKENEIAGLVNDKHRLLSNIVLLEKNISNIKDFIVSLNRYDRFSTVDKTAFNNDDSKYDGSINLVLDRAKTDMRTINLALIDRIDGLKKVKKDLNFDDNIKMVSYQNELSNNELDIDYDVADSIVLKHSLDQNIKYLTSLEEFINDMPFSEPMSINYVSSRFGTRSDPFMKTPKEHHGVDLVGPYMAKVYAPAAGQVIFAGQKGGYGKAVIIEHEHNVKTIYGHLNSYRVKAGDNVKRGDIIGLQGNTGRSTGQHLHYEILRGYHRYDPLDFVKIGSNFY